MRVVIFGGTTEGRELSCALAQEGISVTVSVATEHGREEQPQDAGITVHAGRLEADGMAALLQGADFCIDATHPYAAEATVNIRAAAQKSETPYLRLLRAESVLPANSVIVSNAKAAADFLAKKQGNVLLTTGAKELAAFEKLEKQRLFPRVLPVQASLEACEQLKVPHRNIIAMQGPFSRPLNEAILRQFGICYLVTKDGGAVGGFAEKAEAAEACGVTLVVIRRPPSNGEEGKTMEQILKLCKEKKQCRYT